MTTGSLMRAALAVLIMAAACAAQDGLVAYYSFDKGEGAAVRDDTGHGNDGTIQGGVTRVKAPSLPARASADCCWET